MFPQISGDPTFAKKNTEMKKNPVSLTPAAIYALLLCSACGPTLYIPNSVNTPLLEKKGDFKVAQGVVGYAPYFDWDAQGSYAISDRIAAMANFSLMNPVKDLPKNNHNFLEGGLGAYASFWPNKRSVNIGRAEIFTGLGQGWAKDQDAEGNHFSGSYQRFFIQPGFGIRTRIVDLSLGARISNVHFSNFRQITAGQTLVRESFSFGTYEPVFTVALGYKYVKYYMQFGGVNALGNTQNFEKVNYDLSLGHANFGLIFSPWKEGLKENPPIVLMNNESKTHPKENSEENGATAEPRYEGGEIRQALILPVQSHTFSVCLRDGGAPDGDRVSVSFNGAYLHQNLELNKKPECFELTLIPGATNALYVEAVSDGKTKPNTVQVTLQEGKEDRVFYIRADVGKMEEILFRNR